MGRRSRSRQLQPREDELLRHQDREEEKDGRREPEGRAADHPGRTTPLHLFGSSTCRDNFLDLGENHRTSLHPRIRLTCTYLLDIVSGRSSLVDRTAVKRMPSEGIGMLGCLSHLRSSRPYLENTPYDLGNPPVLLVFRLSIIYLRNYFKSMYALNSNTIVLEFDALV